VREPAEFAAGHLSQAINLPMSRIEREGLQLSNPGSVVFICRSGARSSRAASAAARAGFQGTRQLRGGLLSWRDAIDATLCVVEVQSSNGRPT